MPKVILFTQQEEMAFWSYLLIWALQTSLLSRVISLYWSVLDYIEGSLHERNGSCRKFCVNKLSSLTQYKSLSTTKHHRSVIVYLIEIVWFLFKRRSSTINICLHLLGRLVLYEKIIVKMQWLYTKKKLNPWENFCKLTSINRSIF